MNHHTPPHELDEQICEALSVEASPEGVARLEDFWRQQVRVERRRRRVRIAAAMGMAMAGMVVVAVSVRDWRDPVAGDGANANSVDRVSPVARDRSEQLATAVDPPIPTPAASDPTHHHDSPPPRPSSSGRPPTPYELLLVAGRMPKPVAREGPSPVDVLDNLLSQLSTNPDADALELFNASSLTDRNLQQLLPRQLPRSSDERKHAVLRLLAVRNTPQSTRLLLQLSRYQAFRVEALTVIERRVGIERLASVVGQTTDRRVRRALLARLLTANSEPALRGYLALLARDAIRPDALTVADAVGEPAIPGLLVLLEDPDKNVRLAAAGVLGYMNGPVVTNSLIARVTREAPCPVEAWMALLACRGDRAERFLDHASHQPRLLGQVNQAKTALMVL